MLVRPQPGPQEAFLTTPADLAVYGGSAGGGKTWALLLEPLRHIGTPGFGCVTFRRSYPEITNVGGMWHKSQEIYSAMGGKPRVAELEWRFNKDRTFVKFAHLQHHDTVFDWMGSEITLINFDELTHFQETQFWYMLSRNRSTCGVRPYVRATCNPDASSWVKKFLAPWVDRSYPNPAKSGELRWMLRDGGSITWVPPGTPDALSVTFIRASVYDNKVLLEKDPKYLSNLKALPPLERAQLLEGDWDAVPVGGFLHRPRDCAIAAGEWDALTETFRSVDPEAYRRQHPGSVFVFGGDRGRVVDWTVFTVMEARRHEVVDFMRFREDDPAEEAEKLARMCRKWGVTAGLFESNAAGYDTLERLRRKGVPVTGWTATNATKKAGFDHLADLIATRKITYPDIPPLVSELEALRQTKTATGLWRIAAPDEGGAHDDCPMSLMMAALAAQGEGTAAPPGPTSWDQALEDRLPPQLRSEGSRRSEELDYVLC